MAGERRVAIVTGGSAGIGLSVCERLVAAGYITIMVARTRSTVEAEAARIGAVPWVLDVGDLSALMALPDAVIARFGRLDVLINNAGLHHRGRLERHPPQHFADMVQVNLAAPIVLTRAALPHLPPGGTVVNVASLAGMVPLPEAATYSATKAGLRTFSRAMAEERPDLRFSIVSPGPVDTNFFGDLHQVSDIVFSQPMSTPGAVADAVVACLGQPSTEVAMPRLSGWLCTLGYLAPWLSRWLRPLMQRRGAKNKAAYIAKKQA